MASAMNESTDQTPPASERSQSPSPSSSSRLCQACLSVLNTPGLELEEYYPHHYSLKDFINAADAGCYICSWLLSVLSSDEQKNLKQLAEGVLPESLTIEETPSTLNDPNWDPLGLILRYRMDNSVMRWFNESTSSMSFTGMLLRIPLLTSAVQIHFCLSPNYEQHIPPHMGACENPLLYLWGSISNRFFDRKDDAIIIGTHDDFTAMGLPRSLPSHTGSMETWKTVAGWVRECSEQHDCLANVNTSWYPTRLVERLSDEMFRVIRSDSSLFKPGQGYFTLSHRWGNSDFIQLTAERLGEFENGLPITQLRKTFQDALVVCQRMNISYIWIDSLCIVQSGDDGADWRWESVTMADVYSNSFCNISADWSDETHGLFFKRTPRFESPCSLRMQLNIPEPRQDGLSDPDVLKPPSDGVPRLFNIVRRDGWREDFVEAPLNRRGWVLQERFLSPRVLHFSPQQVSWECDQNLTWEKIPLNFRDSRTSNAHIRDLDRYGSIRRRMNRLRIDDKKDFSLWSRFVASYSSCAFTNQSDKLVAIAGVVKRFRLSVKDQYVAGLWKESLLEGLLWESHQENGRSRYPATHYYTPTFSWTAVDGPVGFRSGPELSGPKTVESAVFIKHRKKPIPCPSREEVRAGVFDEILEDDILGPLFSPEVELRVRGILRSCRLVRPQVETPLTKLDLPHACPSTGAEDSAIQDGPESHKKIPVVLDNVGEEEAPTPHAICYFAIIGCSKLSQMGHYGRQGYGGAYGLLLKSVDADMGRFERLGTAEFSGNCYEPGILLPLGNEERLPAYYDKVTNDHTFYIV